MGLWKDFSLSGNMQGADQRPRQAWQEDQGLLAHIWADQQAQWNEH